MSTSRMNDPDWPFTKTDAERMRKFVEDNPVVASVMLSNGDESYTRHPDIATAKKALKTTAREFEEVVRASIRVGRGLPIEFDREDLLEDDE